ncbi:MAG: glycosyltransferase [Clostridiales bacterium]|nr:glycosyltransferase [Clostridiales bacterium]
MISVIIPTYNRAYCLEKSMRSVLNQTYGNIELIVVDDCSTDNTESVVRSIDDSRLRYIKLGKNGGPSKARNVGIENARGKYIAFHDSDDVCHLDKLEKQYAEIMKDESVLMVFCRYKVFGEKESIVPAADVVNCDDNFFELLLQGNVIGTPTMLVKKSVFDIVGGFNESLSTYEDWELALRLAKNGRISFVDEILLDVYDSKSSVNKLFGVKRINAILLFFSLYWNDVEDKAAFKTLVFLIFAELKFADEAAQKETLDKLNLYFPFSSLFYQTYRLTNDHIDNLSTNLSNMKAAHDNAVSIISNLQNELNLRQNHINNLNDTINNLNDTINNLNNTINFEKSKKFLIKKCVNYFCDDGLVAKLGTNFSLYGAGEVAQILIPLCKKSGIVIPYTIDRKPKIVDGVPSYTVSDIPDKELPIIITAYDPQRSIIGELKKAHNGPIQYLDELLVD